MKKNLESRWKGTEYEIVLEKIKLTESWPEGSTEIRKEILSWMEENEEITLMEEGEKILDGLTENDREVTDGILKDATEIITAIIVARGLVHTGWHQCSRRQEKSHQRG